MYLYICPNRPGRAQPGLHQRRVPRYVRIVDIGLGGIVLDMMTRDLVALRLPEAPDLESAGFGNEERVPAPTALKAAAMKQPGLDGRHRDQDGEISRKHGNTLVSTLRQTYGKNFAPGIDGSVKLSSVLRQLDEPSLSQLARDLQR
jgi:hypothetical protein